MLAHLERFEGAQPIHDRGRFIGAVTGNLEDMEKLCVFLDKLRARLPVFNYQRNTIYVRFCHNDYSKGTVLAEITRHLGLPREQVFAAGDHHNDLAMLDGRFAGHVACPSNSCEEAFPGSSCGRAEGGRVRGGNIQHRTSNIQHPACWTGEPYCGWGGFSQFKQ